MVSLAPPASVNKKLVMTPLTDQELDAVTIVFHQYETGLREGTIYTKVNTRKIITIINKLIINESKVNLL